jgi:nitroimidazol reductase NimA-like FMN-containing flavoprotein (pyridoxamine 5'-phosphate oxidase superfamily)
MSVVLSGRIEVLRDENQKYAATMISRMLSESELILWPEEEILPKSGCESVRCMRDARYDLYNVP